MTSVSGAADQARNAHFIFTGVLTGSIVVLWPQSLQRNFSVKNSTTGAFTLSLGVNNGSGSPAGTTQALAQGATGIYVSDGTNVVLRISSPGSSQYNFFQTNSTSTFTTPGGTTTSTVYKYSVLGSGGGGGGANIAGGAGAGGCTGALCQNLFTGVAAGTGITITVGAGGTGGIAGGSGGSGGNVSIGSPVSVTAGGGGGGSGNTGIVGTGGAPSGSGILLVGAIGTPGLLVGTATPIGGTGGGTIFGTGGPGSYDANGFSGTNPGTGGGGASSAVGTPHNGGNGVAGIVIIEWWQ